MPDPDAPCEPIFRSRTRCGEPRCETHDQPWPCWRVEEAAETIESAVMARTNQTESE